MFKRIHHKLIAMIIVCFVFIQGTGLLAVYQTTETILINGIKTQLQQYEKDFRHQLGQLANHYAMSARLFSHDSNFLTELKNNDHQRLSQVLKNLQQELLLDDVILIKGQSLLISTNPENLQQYSSILALKRAERLRTSIHHINDQIYQLIAMPVNDTKQDVWLLMLKNIDTNNLLDLKHYSQPLSEISFLFKDSSGQWRTKASTLPLEYYHTIDVETNMLIKHNEPQQFIMGDHEYVASLSYLKTLDVLNPVVVIMQINLTKAFEPYQPLITALLCLSVIGISFGIIGSIIIGKNIARPMNILIEAVKRVQKGDYSQAVALRSQDEIGLLAKTFNHMMKGIGSREAQISFQVRHDTTTHLPNKFFYHEKLTQIIERNHTASITIISVGLNNFNDVNFTLGHDTGDMFLRQAAVRIQHQLEPDWFFARLASNSFGIIIPNGSANSDAIVERILAALDTPFITDDLQIAFEASVGLACYPQHALRAKNLMQCADVALYLAEKHHVHGSFIYDKNKDPYNKFDLTLMHALRTGLEEEQFTLFYQPQVCLHSNKLIGVEALLRWTHPEMGVLSPDHFIPMAEQSGNIEHITKFVTLSAIKQAKKWLLNGTPIKISLNISALDLGNEQFSVVLLEALEQYQLPSKLIQIEVTEQALLDDTEQTIDSLTQLASIGIGLSIDDYGTGYSSMHYLKSLPASELKIDKSFVLNLTHNKQDTILVRSAIELAHNLNLEVVAEGVEDRETIKILKTFGCDVAQGYFIGKPMAVRDFEQWMKDSGYGSVA